MDISHKCYLNGQRYLQQMLCETDVVGGNIFHMAYLFQRYDIARYLVETFPQWAYFPYTAGYDLFVSSNRRHAHGRCDVSDEL